MRRAWLGLSLVLGAGLLASSAQAEARRYALVIGANRGDEGEETLRYAESDARRMRDVLVEVGGARSEDVTVLLHPSADEVVAALAQLDTQLRAHATLGDQLIVYASGHADAGAMHLSGTRLPLHALTRSMRDSKASVALLILDSCRSGSATHVKGLEPLEGTRVNVEVPDVSGRVVIGSSGPDEYAQESEQLQASFFTHHLIAGLRGAADASHDGVVTLQEAYSYAYALTVESTFGTRGGVQHPSYSVDLHGQGDLMLSEPSHARGRLRLAVAAAGEWLVYTDKGHSVVGQFEKPEGETVFAVPPGRYRVLERTSTGYLEQRVEVPDGGEAVVRQGLLTRSDFLVTAAKGGASDGLSLALGGSVGTGVTRDVAATGGLALWGAWTHPLGLALPVLDVDVLARSASSSGALAYREDSLELRAGPGLLWRWGRATLTASAMAGEVMLRQAHLASDGLSFAPELGLSPRLRVALFGPVELAVAAFGGGDVVLTDAGRAVRFRADVQVGLGFSR